MLMMICAALIGANCALYSFANALYALGDAVESKRDQKRVRRRNAPCALFGRIQLRSFGQYVCRVVLAVYNAVDDGRRAQDNN